MIWPFENDTTGIEKKLAEKVFLQIEKEISLSVSLF